MGETARTAAEGIETAAVALGETAQAVATEVREVYNADPDSAIVNYQEQMGHVRDSRQGSLIATTQEDVLVEKEKVKKEVKASDKKVD